MSVEQADRIDFIGVDRQSGEVVLTISDHLMWGADSHLYALQEKLNTYLAFVESGEILQKYPDATGRRIAIEILCQYPLDANGRKFVENARSVISGAGIELRHRVHSDTDTTH